jgi:putative MATE family efflux protein
VVLDTENYLAITGLAIPATYVTAVITGTFNGSGNSRTPFIGNAVGLAFNMILDPVMIFTFKLGVTGAAIATAIAQLVVMAFLLAAVKAGRNRPFPQYRYFRRPDGQTVGQIFKWSVPIGLESMLFTMLTMITSRFIASYGANAMAVSRVGSQIESLSWLIGGGYGSALTAFVGQNYGAGKWTRIHRSFRISMGAMTLWGVAVTLILVFGGRFLFTLFLPDPAVVDLGAGYLRVLATCQLAMCIEAVASGEFRGIGKTMQPSLVSIVSNLLRVPLAYLLSQTSMGIYGVFLGIALGAVSRGIWGLVWYLITMRRQPQEDRAVAG